MVLSPSDIRVIFPITLNSGKMEYAKENTHNIKAALLCLFHILHFFLTSTNQRENR
jgi:hypothetical protein